MPPKPSLPHQVLLYFNRWYTIIYFWVSLMLMQWKRKQFLYVNGAFGWETTMLVFVAIIDLARQELGSRGNKTGHGVLILWSLALAIPAITGYSFFLRLQSYVLQMDIILNAVGITFVSMEFIFGLASMIGSMPSSGCIQFGIRLQSIPMMNANASSNSGVIDS